MMMTLLFSLTKILPSQGKKINKNSTIGYKEKSK